MLKKYFMVVGFIALNAALFGVIGHALMSHKSHELPFVGMMLIVVYIPCAVLLVKKIAE